MNNPLKPLIRVLPIALAALLAGPAEIPAATAESLCDPGLQGSPGSSLAYRMRGNRCEGIYALQVSSTQIWLASFTDALDLDAANDQDLTLSWQAPATAQTLSLRAQSLRPRTYYRMDTAVQLPATRFAWPSDVVASLQLSADEVGLLGWTKLAVHGSEREVYLPVTVSQAQAPAPQEQYRIAFVASMRLSEVYISLTPLDENGTPRQPVFADLPLGYGYYPAKEATVFVLDRQPKAGLYQLDISCTMMDGSSATTSFWLYLGRSS